MRRYIKARGLDGKHERLWRISVVPCNQRKQRAIKLRLRQIIRELREIDPELVTTLQSQYRQRHRS